MKETAANAELVELTTAAEQGDAKAQYNVGVMYALGQGVSQDYQIALYWITTAAEQGYALAQDLLGRIFRDGQYVPQDYPKAIQWFLKAAKQGCAIAQLNLGIMYYSGQGTPGNYIQAYAWLRVAAANNEEVREFALEFRDLSAAKLTPQDLSEALALSEEYYQRYVVLLQ